MLDSIIHDKNNNNEEYIKNEIFEIMEHSYEYSSEIKKLKNISMEFLMDGFTNWLPEIAEHMCTKLHRAQIYSNENFEINPYPISLLLTLGVDKSTKQKCFDGISFRECNSTLIRWGIGLKYMKEKVIYMKFILY